jgi:carbamoyl-phosphate synthase large subunit
MKNNSWEQKTDKIKKILITNAGGSPSTNFVRSLRRAPEKFYLIGVDCNKYYLQRAETDEKHLVPSKDDKDYVNVLNQIIEETGAEFIHFQNSAEIEIISEKREMLKTKFFLPAKETIRICQNKFESYRKWEENGLPQPKTLFLNNEDDLKKAFEVLGDGIWLREIKGSGGRGSLLTKSFKEAKSWIDFKEGWGKFTAADYLSPQSITWQSIWHNGELVVAQTRKRLYWELAKISPSGITGSTGGAITVSDPMVDDIAQKAILAIDGKPHGIFSVDMTYDKNNAPNPTEINIARFFTTHEFFTRAGLNMPYIFIKLAFGEPYPEIKKKINPLPENLAWIRGMDFLPVLTTVDEIEKYEEKYKKRLKNKKS